MSKCMPESAKMFWQRLDEIKAREFVSCIFSAIISGVEHSRALTTSKKAVP